MKNNELDFNEIFDQSKFGEQYIIYLNNRIGNPYAVWDNMDNEALQQEFIAKCQFFQHYAKTKLNVANVTMETAATMVNNAKAVSFDADVCGKLFDGFMHFIAVNEKNPTVLKSLMDTWVNQGRSLEEKIIVDGLEFTPLNFVVAKNNLAAFVELAKHGVDVTGLDSAGFSELHKLIDQIDQGTSDISMLKAWVDANLPTDMVADGRAGEFAGKTAVQVAQDKGWVKITTQLDGDVDLAKQNLDNLYEEQKANLITAYYNKVLGDEQLSAIVSEDLNKLLLHYLVENFANIPVEVFQKFIADESLGIRTNLVGLERVTPLELLVKQGVISDKANQFALVLAKHGVGTTEQDNGTTLLSYTIKHNNNQLFDLILKDNLTVLENLGKMIEKGSIQIVDSPLANALLSGKVEMVVKLVKHGFTKCNVIIPTKGEVEFGVIQSIKALGGGQTINLIKSVAKYVDMKAEVVVQEMVNALMEGEAALVKALVENGADINHNNGEALKLFVGAGQKYLPAVKLAIENGAKVTEEIKMLSIQKGTNKLIAGYIKHEEISKPLSTNEKMKLLVKKLVLGDESYKGIFGNEPTYLKIADNLKANPGSLKSICKVYGMDIDQIESMGNIPDEIDF